MLDSKTANFDLVMVLFFIFVFIMFVVRLIIEEGIYSRRLAYIEAYSFRPELAEKLVKYYPHLTQDEIEQALGGLRTYFLLRLRHRCRIAMPSRVVDALWHEFILCTVDYQAFCQAAFGKFLHHVPFSAGASQNAAEASLQNIWKQSCEREGINPVFPDKLPLLFDLDTKLKISGRFGYSVENGVYPRLKIALSPASLIQEIEKRHGE